MADDEWYYAAIVASGISTVAWIATVGAGAAAGYYAITSGPALQYARWTVIALVVAILFAQVEKRLYRIEDR
jgi:hypothetical protein